ncbi:MAG: hypothetical protein IJA55_09385 [Clostridia bacterium]|nr:hypothetical protein [Clostridia bacterium]
MKGIKRITAIGLCILFLILSIPVMGLAGYNDPDSVFGNLFSFVSTVAETGYSVDRDGNNSYLYFDGEKVTDIGMHFDGTDYYYVLTDSTLACGEKIYAYNNNGLLDKAYYYFEDDCKMRKDGWLELDEGTLHYENGIISQGLTKIDDDFYFFELNRGYLLKDRDIFVNDDNKYNVKPGTYSFDAQGKMTGEAVILPDLGKGATATGIVMYNTFSDDMMFQRDQSLSVWGLADASSGKVIVEFAGQTAEATVNADRTWKATFDNTFPYSTTPRDMTIHGADADVVLKDVLIGDVYYVIGQSNVFYDMQVQINDLAVNGGSMSYDFDDSRNLRFYRNSALYTAGLTGILAQGTTTEFVDAVVDYNWMTPSDVEENLSSSANQDNTHRAFSALGYLLAYNLSNKTDVPIGIIEIDAAGMPLTAFAPNSLADKWGDDTMDPATGIYTYNLRQGMAQPTMKSRFVYNQLINPLKGFSTAGVVWYQGESDLLNHIGLWGEDHKTFAYQFTELMTYYRNNFGDGSYDFPVYMIEIPACFSNSGQNAYLTMGGVRSDQGVISKLLDNFHLVSSADFFSNITWPNSLHPYIKHLQAQRLANIVAADRYNVSNMAAVQGPYFDSASYGANTVTVSFSNVGSGLKVYENGKLYGFEVCTGKDANGFLVWEYAEGAAVSGTNTVTVTHSKSFNGVRYHAQDEAYYPGIPGFDTFCATLAGGNGIPATAFVDMKD